MFFPIRNNKHLLNCKLNLKINLLILLCFNMKNKKCNDTVLNQICKKVNKPKKHRKAVVTGAAVVVVDKHGQHLAPDLYAKKANGFLKSIKRDYKRLLNLSKCCIAEQQRKIQQNEQELDELKKYFNNMQVEEAEIKRKRWCRYCEAEAIYISSKEPNFYCSTECEEYQRNLMVL